MAASIFQELKRRRVFRALIAYGVVAFAIIQVIEPIMHGLHWPDAVLSYVVVGLAVGFPIVVALAWIFDVKPSGIERATPATGIRAPQVVLLILALGVVGALPGLAWYYLRHDRAVAASKAPAAVFDKKPPQIAPSDQRWVVPIGESPARGPADALVTIVEFGDYQCPFTKLAEPFVKAALSKYPDKVRLIWKDYPMGAHAESDGAAQLAREALRQKGVAGWWQAHDRLLEMSPHVAPDKLEKLATDLGLDVAEVRKALSEERYRAAIDADVDLLARVGQSGIPTFFVNGRPVQGAEPELINIVADELADARRRIASGAPTAGFYDSIQRQARPSAPPNPRVNIPDPKQRPARGGPAGKALVVHEFCDLSSPICAWIEPMFRKTMASYGDEVRVVWWDLYDPQQPVPLRVAKAARSVTQAPDGFWKLHDGLLASLRLEGFQYPPPERLAIPALREQARAAGGDLTLFDYMVTAQAAAAQEDDELREARSLGRQLGDVVIDGQVLSGFSPPRLWRLAIDGALARRK